MVGPSALIDGCLEMLEWSALYGSAVPQAAATAALRGPRNWLADIPIEFQARRDRLVGVLRELGLPTVLPRGGPFLFPFIADHGGDDDVARQLLHDFGIGVVAGRLLHGPGHVRLPIGSDPETLDVLVDRLRHAFGVPAAGVRA